MGQMGLSWHVPIVLGTQDGRDNGRPPSGADGIILGCPNYPWDTDVIPCITLYCHVLLCKVLCVTAQYVYNTLILRITV